MMPRDHRAPTGIWRLIPPATKETLFHSLTFLSSLSKRAVFYLVFVPIALAVIYFYTSSLAKSAIEPFHIGNTAEILLQSSDRDIWDRCLDSGRLNRPAPYYLSIVIVARSDNYAGEQQHRLQNFIDSTYLLAQNTRVKIELIVVEWNPPTDRRSIIDSYRFRRSDSLVYRILTVPKEIHDVIPNTSNAPFREFEGRNLGIRFARGEFVVCTNQDDIWSPLFHDAIKARAFKKDIIYLQHQDLQNIHDESLPPKVVHVQPLSNDDILSNSCMPSQQGEYLPGSSNWGRLSLSRSGNVNAQNILKVADQARDFTLAHRLTWRVPRAYRETDSITWVDIEFICTAAWTFGVQVLVVDDVFACHQDRPNLSEEQQRDIKDIDIERIEKGEAKYMNEEGTWGMQKLDIWSLGLKCIEFKGGLAW